MFADWVRLGSIPPPPRKEQAMAQTSQVATEDYQAIEARPINDLRIYLGEQIGIVGATGTGKTVFTCKGLLTYMQKHYPEVPRYIVDSTGDPDMDTLVPNSLHVDGNRAPD